MSIDPRGWIAMRKMSRQNHEPSNRRSKVAASALLVRRSPRRGCVRIELALGICIARGIDPRCDPP